MITCNLKVKQANHLVIVYFHGFNTWVKFSPFLFLFLSQHTEADFQARFKGRPELDGLIAQINQ